MHQCFSVSKRVDDPSNHFRLSTRDDDDGGGCRMCKMCQKLVRYADVYNDAFASPDKGVWITRMLGEIEKACLFMQVRYMHYVCTAVRTQGIFEGFKTKNEIYMRTLNQAIERVNKVKQFRTRRLARRMLRHTYRPGGNMFRRLVKENEAVSRLSIRRRDNMTSLV